MARTAHLAFLALASIVGCVVVLLGAVASVLVALGVVTLGTMRSLATSVTPTWTLSPRKRIRQATA